MSSGTILCVVGTRPEVIKTAPVVAALRRRGANVRVLATAQHRHLLDQVLAAFDLRPDWDLDLMRDNQGLSDLVGRMLPKLDDIIAESSAAMVLAQGDTSTVLAAALASFHRHVPFGHIEAGLRSGDLAAPFPEEANRRVADVLATYHFAPTAAARDVLLREGTPAESVFVVGNTVIDSLLEFETRGNLPWPPAVPRIDGERIVLVTLHRREHFGEPFSRIIEAIRRFALEHVDARIVYPVHPNPNVAVPARKALGGLRNVHLLPGLDYATFVNVLRHSYLVLTDSGGLQEEAPALGKPVLVFRNVTERPEAVWAGGAALVGTEPAVFLAKANELWTRPEVYAAMAQRRFPYGDGHAGERIAAIVLERIQRSPHWP